MVFLVMSEISWFGRRAKHEEVIVEPSGIPADIFVDMWSFWTTGASDWR